MAKKKPDPNFRFYVGSLINPNPTDYIAVCNQHWMSPEDYIIMRKRKKARKDYLREQVQLLEQ